MNERLSEMVNKSILQHGLPKGVGTDNVGEFYNRTFDSALTALGEAQPPYTWLDGDESIVPAPVIGAVRRLVNSVVLLAK